MQDPTEEHLIVKWAPCLNIIVIAIAVPIIIIIIIIRNNMPKLCHGSEASFIRTIKICTRLS